MCIVEQLVEFIETFASICYLDCVLLHKSVIITIHHILYMNFYDQSSW
jgi:hypothetical protein